MTLSQRLKKLEDSIHQEDDIIVVCQEGDIFTEQEIEEAKAKARAGGRKIVLLGEIEEWGQ